MSDVFAAIVTGCFAVVILAMQQRNARQAAKMANQIAVVARSTHVLVNSKMQWQLRQTAHALRRIADLTKEAKDDIAATLAERISLDHDATQASIDFEAAR